MPAEWEERAAYVVSSRFAIGGETFESRRLPVYGRNGATAIAGGGEARLILLVGAPTGGRPHIWSNFAASAKEWTAQAKVDRATVRFARVHGGTDLIPLSG